MAYGSLWEGYDNISKQDQLIIGWEHWKRTGEIPEQVDEAVGDKLRMLIKAYRSNPYFAKYMDERMLKDKPKPKNFNKEKAKKLYKYCSYYKKYGKLPDDIPDDWRKTMENIIKSGNLNRVLEKNKENLELLKNNAWSLSWEERNKFVDDLLKKAQAVGSVKTAKAKNVVSEIENKIKQRLLKQMSNNPVITSYGTREKILTRTFSIPESETTKPPTNNNLSNTGISHSSGGHTGGGLSGGSSSGGSYRYPSYSSYLSYSSYPSYPSYF